MSDEGIQNVSTADHFARNEIAFAIPASELAMYQAFNISDLFRRTEEVRLHPWKAADRNPMPRLDWWPLIDRAIWWRTEAPQRVRDALDVLRDGLPDRSDW